MFTNSRFLFDLRGEDLPYSIVSTFKAFPYTVLSLCSGCSFKSCIFKRAMRDRVYISRQDVFSHHGYAGEEERQRICPPKVQGFAQEI